MSESETAEIEDCREFLRQGYVSANPSGLQRLSVSVYRKLAAGRPVLKADLAHQLRIPLGQIDQLLNLVPGNALEYNEAGDIVGFIGLSLKPSNHQLIVNGYKLYTWCVLDALFLPSLLQSEAMLVTKCPATGQTIEVSLSPRHVLSSSHPEPVMSLTESNRAACCDDLRGCFCDHVNLFAGFAAFGKWRKGHPHLMGISLPEACDLALERNEWRYPDIDWQSPDQPADGENI